MDGLDITENEFMKLNVKDQNLILFKNVVYIRTQFKSYYFHRKIQYVWLSVLTTCTLVGLGIKQWFF